MGTGYGYICGVCEARFMVSSGGGFSFDLLYCDTCGTGRSVGHGELGAIHLGFVKGLPGPYAVARARADAQIKAEFQGEPLTRDEYHAQAEGTLAACSCGGHFRYDAPARCPNCRSTADQWSPDPSVGMACYD